MQSLTFQIPGRPHGKGRPRFDADSGHAYTPDETKAYESKVAELATMVRPAEWDTEDRYEIRVRASYPDAVVSDLSNIVKAIEDGAEGVLWENDRSIVRIVAERHDDLPIEEGRVDVEVRRFEGATLVPGHLEDCDA